MHVVNGHAHDVAPRGRTPAGLNGTAKCRLCTCLLGQGDNTELRICAECEERPEAARLGEVPRVDEQLKGAREFTDAEHMLINSVGGHMSDTKLLSILNERLRCDLGPDAAPYTKEQLAEARGPMANVETTDASTWAGLRKLLRRAERAGTLARIDEQVINDFAVAFSLAPAQLLAVKDIVLRFTEEVEHEA